MGKTFKDAMNDKLDEFRKLHLDREITIWDLFLSLVDGKEYPYILVLKADYPILERIAKGLSPSHVAGQLGIMTLDVVETAKLWGFKPLSITLDFDPMFVYRDDMSPQVFMSEINEILAIPITLDTAKKVVYNIEQLKTVRLFLEDVDD